MDSDQLVELELSRVDWSQVRDGDGPATNIPVALRRLLAASSAEECHAPYWGMENHAVIQGAVFEAALPLVPAILAALTCPKRPSYVRISLMELLFQIVHGETHPEEVARGLGDVAEQCRVEAQKGLWLFYREAFAGELRAAAVEILQVIDDDGIRAALLATMPDSLANKKMP